MTKENTYLIFFIGFALVASMAIINGGYVRQGNSCGVYNTEEILLGDKILNVEISDDKCKRELGLSGRKELRKDSGMLFIFEEENINSIWMKDMKFPLDIIWINSNEEIVLIEKEVDPNTYPLYFGDGVISKFVVEVSSGFSEENNLQVGDKVSILKD